MKEFPTNTDDDLLADQLLNHHGVIEGSDMAVGTNRAEPLADTLDEEEDQMEEGDDEEDYNDQNEDEDDEEEYENNKTGSLDISPVIQKDDSSRIQNTEDKGMSVAYNDNHEETTPVEEEAEEDV